MTTYGWVLAKFGTSSSFVLVGTSLVSVLLWSLCPQRENHGYLLDWKLGGHQDRRMSGKKNKKCWEELKAYFTLIRHGPHTKWRVLNFLYCRVCIRCSGNVFTEPLTSNDRRIHIHVQTHRLMGDKERKKQKRRKKERLKKTWGTKEKLMKEKDIGKRG
jgi:hypothetical protein